MIRLDACAVRRGAARLGPFDLAVPEGEYHVLLGPSGAGKTTMLGLVAGLLRPDEGRADAAAPVGFLLQDHPLFPHRNVLRNVAFGPLARGASRTVAERRARDALRLAGLPGFEARDAHALSGGERRRVALAQVLATEPRTLLLDEPTLNLDPPTRAALLHDLRRIQRERTLAVLHVTHDFEEAAAQADRVSVLRAGRIVQQGTAPEVFREPRDAALARFVGVENLLDGTVLRVDGRAWFDTGRNRLAVAATDAAPGPARAALRAEDVLLAREPPRTSARNALPGRVIALEERGALVRVTVDAAGDLLRARVTPPAAEDLGLALGVEVVAVFKASAVRLL